MARATLDEIRLRTFNYFFSLGLAGIFSLAFLYWWWDDRQWFHKALRANNATNAEMVTTLKEQNKILRGIEMALDDNLSHEHEHEGP